MGKLLPGILPIFILIAIGVVYITTDDQRVYTVTSLSEESRKAKLEATLDAIVHSFRIL